MRDEQTKTAAGIVLAAFNCRQCGNLLPAGASSCDQCGSSDDLPEDGRDPTEEEMAALLELLGGKLDPIVLTEEEKAKLEAHMKYVRNTVAE